MSYQQIENYGIIGDLHTVALVGMDGSIDFMSFPHFDSPTIFARLLDHEHGGVFKLSPVFSEESNRKQTYLSDTNILFTRFLSNEGVAEISDFMPVEQENFTHEIVRRAKTIRGEVRYRMICAPRFHYGRDRHGVEQKDGSTLFISKNADGTALRLRGSRPVKIENGSAFSEFTLAAGETAQFILEQAHVGRDSPSAADHFVANSFKRTSDFWRNWIGRSTYRGHWRETVNRSAMTLKLLTSLPHGSIVAAPTFGLPEEIGGQRNWDYRYTWIRDASFTLYALMRLGYTEEAAAFMNWIEKRCDELEPDGSLQTIYRSDGGRVEGEEELVGFEGYRKSKPVRIGNAASAQLQLDIYGELMDSVYLYNKYGDPISYGLWNNLTRLVDWVCANWQRPDHGIWEVRADPREFLHSKLMCWVAIDRGVRLAQKRSFPAPLERWQKVRNEIYRHIFENFWDEERKTFVQHKGAKALDASSLLMPLVKFLGPTDPYWISTLNAIERELVDDSLVFRYKTAGDKLDGLTGTEGTFMMCSFWYVECLARAGRIQEARHYFEKALGYGNHLGLFSEEIGPRGQHLGNFPQALTHLALISAAFDIDRRLSKAGWNA